MDRPNLLIFMTDHQRGDTVLPEHPAVMPNVARLGAEGVTFAETFCPSPHCCPCRATFHSGLYPSRHGVWNNVCNDQALSRGPRPGVRLWSEDFADAGYEMIFSGKWHVSSEETPKDCGWRELVVSGDKPREHGVAWEGVRRLAEKPEHRERGEGQMLRPGWGTYTAYGTREDGNAFDERAVSEAVAAMPGTAASGRPWAMFVGAQGPHDPYFVPQRFRDLYDVADVPLPPSFADTLEDKPRVYKRMRDTRFGQLTEREVREAIRHFWAYCSYLDDLFGRLLAALEETGQAENTLVLYCSDHGDYLGDHGLFCKGIPCFRGAYHVPAVVRWPAGTAEPGRRVEELVSLADFAPTFLDLAAIDADRDFTGASLVPFFEGRKPEDWRDALFTQCDGVELYYTQRAAWTKDHKYVFNGFDEDELYDLRADPHEMRNLAADPAFEKVKHDLVRRLWQFAEREDDAIVNTAYITTSLMPWGPAEALR